MSYFLIVFDRAHGRILQEKEFSEVRRAEALGARFREEANHRGQPNIEVVVLGGTDRAALEKTHRRYFGKVEELSRGGA